MPSNGRCGHDEECYYFLNLAPVMVNLTAASTLQGLRSVKCRCFQVSRSALFLCIHQCLELEAFSKKYFSARMFSYELVPFSTFLKV